MTTTSPVFWASWAQRMTDNDSRQSLRVSRFYCRVAIHSRARMPRHHYDFCALILGFDSVDWVRRVRSLQSTRRANRSDEAFANALSSTVVM